jgi:hypothetical protein
MEHLLHEHIASHDRSGHQRQYHQFHDRPLDRVHHHCKSEVLAEGVSGGFFRDLVLIGNLIFFGFFFSVFVGVEILGF